MPDSKQRPLTPQLLSLQTTHDGLQVDAWSIDTVLLSLEMGGSPWPSSCRNGTCRTCIGMLRKGQVRYEIEWPGITAEEQEEGYMLPCVAFPCSNLELAPAV